MPPLLKRNAAGQFSAIPPCLTYLPVLLTGVIEQCVDFRGKSRDDVGVEQCVETGKQECADNYGDENLHAGINIAFCLLVGDTVPRKRISQLISDYKKTE